MSKSCFFLIVFVFFLTVKASCLSKNSQNCVEYCECFVCKDDESGKKSCSEINQSAGGDDGGSEHTDIYTECVNNPNKTVIPPNDDCSYALGSIVLIVIFIVVFIVACLGIIFGAYRMFRRRRSSIPSAGFGNGPAPTPFL